MNPLTYNLLTWYQTHQRDLPWRKTKDPYRIWVSEVMLQQTQVEVVIDKYNLFIEAYPTLISLAKAKEEDVLKLWQGLGYYSRARRLLKAVKSIKDKPFPDYKEFLSLKGVGEYTASAVFSIAFDEKRVAADGNVLRISARLFSQWGPITSSKVKRQLIDLLQGYLPPKNRGDFNQALMDLGSSICTPKKPNCQPCPLQSYCVAFKEGTTEKLPLKGPAITPRRVEVDIYWINSHDGKILLRKRNHSTFLQGLWELPWEEKMSYSNMVKEEGATYHPPKPITDSFTTDYVFSHKHWKITVKKYLVDREYHQIREDEEYRFVPMEELPSMGIATVFLKVLRLGGCIL